MLCYLISFGKVLENWGNSRKKSGKIFNLSLYEVVRNGQSNSCRSNFSEEIGPGLFKPLTKLYILKLRLKITGSTLISDSFVHLTYLVGRLMMNQIMEK